MVEYIFVTIDTLPISCEVVTVEDESDSQTKQEESCSQTQQGESSSEKEQENSYEELLSTIRIFSGKHWVPTNWVM